MKVLYRLFVNGVPRAQSRPRLGKYGNFYSDSKPVKAWKKEVKAAFLSCRCPTIIGPVKLTVAFFLPSPKSMKLASGTSFPHTKRPDTDNLLKAVMDSMSTAGVWEDDAQVYGINVGKYYAADRVGAQITVEADY